MFGDRRANDLLAIVAEDDRHLEQLQRHRGHHAAQSASNNRDDRTHGLMHGQGARPLRAIVPPFKISKSPMKGCDARTPMVEFLTKLLLVERSRLKSRARREAENLLLRQQLIVLRRKSPNGTTLAVAERER